MKSLILAALALGAVAQQTVRTPAETEIGKAVGGLRAMPDDARAAKTRELALRIRALPDGAGKVGLAEGLCNLATEGDFGPGTLQAVADTLATAVQATPPKPDDYAYIELANLARYEGLRIDLDTPAYRNALAQVDALRARRAKLDFTLADQNGKPWTLSKLRGKVVVVNFWATWCPPCRKEMPDLDALQARFGDRLVILGITDEKPETVAAYLKDHPVRYPVLFDPGRKVNTLYEMQGIPNNYVYDRRGRLAAQSIDMRTRGQFLRLLAKAGLE